MLHYRKYRACGRTEYEAWTVDTCSGDKVFAKLSSPTIQAVVAHARKKGLSLKKHD